MSDTITVAGTDLRTYLTPIGLLKVIGLPPSVGEDYQIPGYVGAIPARLGRGPRTVTVGGLILGKSVQTPMQDQDVTVARNAYRTKLEAFSSLVFQNGEPFVLGWVSTTGAPPDPQPPSPVVRVAEARYLGGIDDIEQLTPWAGRVAVDFLLLTPFWE